MLVKFLILFLFCPEGSTKGLDSTLCTFYLFLSYRQSHCCQPAFLFPFCEYFTFVTDRLYYSDRNNILFPVSIQTGFTFSAPVAKLTPSMSNGKLTSPTAAGESRFPSLSFVFCRLVFSWQHLKSFLFYSETSYKQEHRRVWRTF